MIKAQWPAPTWVHAITTTREHGNIHVYPNQLLLTHQLGLKKAPAWLNQTHSTTVALVTEPMQPHYNADGSITQLANTACVVFTADCLPVFLCDEAGTVVSVLHCGWRGLLGGIIENAVEQLHSLTAHKLMAWLGPAIGPDAFEVGPEVYEAYTHKNQIFSRAFKKANEPDKWYGDLYQLARLHLQQAGVNAVYGGEHCTFTQKEQFFSYRRDYKNHKTREGMASIIWFSS